MLTDWHFLAVAIIAVTALGLAKGGFTAIGSVATPLVALVLPPFDAAALLLPILIVQDIISLWVYRGDWSARNLKLMLPGAVIGVGIAWLLAVHLLEAVVRLIIGAIGLAFVLNAWIGRNAQASVPYWPRGVFWGGVAGFTSAFANAGGPPYQVYMLPQRLPKMTFVGTTAIFFATVNWLKVVPYFALGNFSRHGLLMSLALMPIAIAANFLGIWLVRVTPVELFYRIAYVLVFILSTALIWQGGTALWRG